MNKFSEKLSLKVSYTSFLIAGIHCTNTHTMYVWHIQNEQKLQESNDVISISDFM